MFQTFQMPFSARKKRPEFDHKWRTWLNREGGKDCIWKKTVCVCVLVTQSCLTLCDPMVCSLPGSSVLGILQAILEWVAILFSRVFSQPRDWTWVSWIVGRFFTIWATREAIVVSYPGNTVTHMRAETMSVTCPVFSAWYIEVIPLFVELVQHLSFSRSLVTWIGVWLSQSIRDRINGKTPVALLVC